jgi:hypothetical protein
MEDRAEWGALYAYFRQDLWSSLRVLLPEEFQANARLTQNIPSADDPLGSRAFLELHWMTPVKTGEQPLMTLRVQGQWSPYLEPAVLRTWLIVEHPDLFRWRP